MRPKSAKHSRSTHITEDKIREDYARVILGLYDTDQAKAGTGQITTFNELGFAGYAEKPDGWYLPYDLHQPAIILDTKNNEHNFNAKDIQDLEKHCKIAHTKYKNVVGILYNGIDIMVYKNEVLLEGETELHNKEYYLGLFDEDIIDRQKIFAATKAINEALHYGLKVKNLYHRMIFTACALVARRYDVHIDGKMSYEVIRYAIKDKLKTVLANDIGKNAKLQLLIDIFDSIRAETPDNEEAIEKFVSKVNEIAEVYASTYWKGTDVMAIFFNEFNRYKGKSESGQVFTPDHIASLMYRIIGVDMTARVLDAACGSGTFLVKAMWNMIGEAGGEKTDKAEEIKQQQIFGIELDREIYSLACANMLIHKDGRTNISNEDARSPKAYEWIKSKGITKVLMNPPFENKYGCLDIVLNTLNAVADSDPAVHPDCAFILPDKKLEKKNQVRKVRAILKSHCLVKIIKLPEKTFEGVNCSIFVFKAGVPQKDKTILGWYIEEDGLDTIKNQGRQDVFGNWKEKENYWVKVFNSEKPDPTFRLIDPKRHLSYPLTSTVPIARSLFNSTLVEYKFFKNRVNYEQFCENISKTVTIQTDFPAEYKDLYSRFMKLAKTYKGDSLVDTSDWGEIALTDILKKKGRGERLRKQDRKPGDIPLATAGFRQQGISEYISNPEQAVYSNVITIDMFCNCFWRDYEFCCDDNVLVFETYDDVSAEAKLFLCAIINAYSQRFGDKYNYDNQFRDNSYKKESIYLPVTSSGAPDWEKMTDFIKSLPMYAL